jgi:hypothetical protein
MAKILFILKHRDAPWGDKSAPYGYGLSSGLRNSVRFVVDMLNLSDIDAKWVEVANANFIDKEVHEHRPTHVIIEAFWVVPAKFDELRRLHPHVTWSVRNHSETAFLSSETNPFNWLAGYWDRGIEVMCNAPRSVADISAVAHAYGHRGCPVSYAPNYYPLVPASKIRPHHFHADDTVRIGCFGAIRPLKNHMEQAVAAVQFAEKIGKKLEFHINAARIEMGANRVLGNLQMFFNSARRAKLVQHPWLSHQDFLTLLHSIDFSMQVSFSETFNIVAADSVVCSVPVVASEEVAWLGSYAMADPNSSQSILYALHVANRGPIAGRLMQQWRDLHAYNVASQRTWVERFS